MRASFLTLACPDWDLPTIVERGKKYGFDGVDFRGLLGQMDITRLPEFTTGLNATRRCLADSGLAVSCISTGISICDGAAKSLRLDEAKRTINLAHELQVSSIRVLGGGDPDSVGVNRAVAEGADTLAAILQIPGASRLRWNIETFGPWVRRDRCHALLKAVNHPSVGLVWDVFHTLREAGESPRTSVAAYGPHIHYVHVKDAARVDGNDKNPWRRVLPGAGELPLATCIRELQRIRYNGWIAFEHIKHWLPELEHADVALPAFTAWIQQTLAHRAFVHDPTGRPVLIS